MRAMHNDLLIHLAAAHVQDNMERATAARTKRELRGERPRGFFSFFRKPRPAAPAPVAVDGKPQIQVTRGWPNSRAPQPRF
jgi:hypothetical protein